MKQPVFTGAAAAIVTPMHPDFSVNFAALDRLLDELIQGGIDAVVPCGTTGESSTLTEEEYARIGEAVTGAFGDVYSEYDSGETEVLEDMPEATPMPIPVEAV